MYGRERPGTAWSGRVRLGKEKLKGETIEYLKF